MKKTLSVIFIVITVLGIGSLNSYLFAEEDLEEIQDARSKNVETKSTNNDYEVILSLTTWKGRINDPMLPLVLYRLVEQQVTKHRYKVVLVLSTDEFGEDFVLPEGIQKFIDRTPDKFEVLWTKENTRALKKLDPTIEKYPNNYIATMDDDELMQPWLVDYLCQEIAIRPRTILGAWCGPYRGVNRVGLCRLFICQNPESRLL